MKVLSVEQTREILEASEEGLRLEFKESFDIENSEWLYECVIRAILAMSNTRMGGDVVIGVKENPDKTFSFEGMESDHLNKFKSKIDDLKTQVESFSVSPISFDVYEAVLSESQKFILIRVAEFRRTPTICRKNGKMGKLELGAIYVRTLKDKPSSIRAIDPLDIQDLLERSVDKEITILHQRGWTHFSEVTSLSSGNFAKERESF